MEISSGSLSSDVAATPGPSHRLCDICSRINIESLLSPEGFPISKKGMGGSCSCVMCSIIFYAFRGQKDGTRVRIKLSQGQSKMRLVTWFLRIEGGKHSVPTQVPVFTREGWRFVYFHSKWSVDF
jgi:hypothetical protein